MNFPGLRKGGIGEMAGSADGMRRRRGGRGEGISRKQGGPNEFDAKAANAGKAGPMATENRGCPENRGKPAAGRPVFVK
jgi:hypothetical protein